MSNLEKNTTDSCFPPRHRFSTNPLTTKSRESRIFCQGFTRPQAKSWGKSWATKGNQKNLKKLCWQFSIPLIERIFKKIAHYLGPMFSLIGDVICFHLVLFLVMLEDSCRKQKNKYNFWGTYCTTKNKYKSMQSLHHLKRVLPTFIQLSTRRLDVSPLRAPPQLPRDAHQQQPPANTTGRTVLILRASHLKFNQLMCSKCDSTWTLSSCMLKVHIQCR